MDKYVCVVCGYVYDPEIGDPRNGVDPGTPFKDLPGNWRCPVCGAEKAFFQKIQHLAHLLVSTANRFIQQVGLSFVTQSVP